MGFKDDHPNDWLAYLTAISRWPETSRSLAEKYPGVVCYRDTTGGHFWIQKFNSDGTLWLLHGRDSTLAGLDVPSDQGGDLRECGCGNWMPASQQQIHDSRGIMAVAATLHRRTKNKV